jgi:hypothetical protein
MAESWVRLWAGYTTDPKWQTIARKSGQPRYLVMALFTHLMLEANEADIRGDISAVSVEDVASALDCDEDQVQSILDAMQGRVIEDVRLSGWNKRQPAREDSGDPQTGAMSSTDRSREHRRRKDLESRKTQPNATHATHATDLQRNATQCNAPEAEAEAEAEAEGIPKGEEVVLGETRAGEVHPPPPQKTAAVCIVLKSEGIGKVNPSHPTLAALLQEGADVGHFASVARDCVARGKPNFTYVLAVVKGQMRDAAVLAAESLAKPRDSPRQAESFAERERRHKRDQWEGMTGLKWDDESPQQAGEVIDITPQEMRISQ